LWLMLLGILPLIQNGNGKGVHWNGLEFGVLEKASGTALEKSMTFFIKKSLIGRVAVCFTAVLIFNSRTRGRGNSKWEL
jgi:hypothetical protein